MENDRMGFYTGVYHFKNYLPYPREGGGKGYDFGETNEKIKHQQFSSFWLFSVISLYKSFIPPIQW